MTGCRANTTLRQCLGFVLSLVAAACTPLDPSPGGVANPQAEPGFAGDGSLPSTATDGAAMQGAGPGSTGTSGTSSGAPGAPGSSGTSAPSGGPDPAAAASGAAGDGGMTPGMAGCMETELECHGACVPRDERNCGACGVDCTSLPNVQSTIACVSDQCELVDAACKPGFAHCSGVPEDGCETDLSKPETCGSCTTACSPDAPLCAGSPDTGFACKTGCMAAAPMLCGGSCVNIMTDVAHCGGCNMSCPKVARATSTCVAGSCETKCDSGYHDCNGECLANNSVDSCGSSCDACDAPSNGSATCDGTRCGLRCNNGYHDCDGQCRNDNDVASCGSRCEPCPTGANARASCTRGRCELQCNTNARDCGDGRCITGRCAVGGDCNGASDCQSGACEGGRCVMEAICGNRMVEGEEECDLGASGNRLECAADCTESTLYLPCSSSTTCGQGQLCANALCYPTSCSDVPAGLGTGRDIIDPGVCAITCNNVNDCPSSRFNYCSNVTGTGGFCFKR